MMRALLVDHHRKGENEMNPFVTFMASTAGRILRIVAGIALIVWGIWGLGGTVGIIVAVVGAVPLLAGIFDFCIFAPLFGNPLGGAEIRKG
jgi:Co/Zn/Cd efflux system component